MIRFFNALLPLVLTSSIAADQLVQSGSLAGGVGPTVHPIVLNQFDDAGGARVLNFVQLDFLTSTSGGGMTTGSGVSVNINVVLSADYLLGMQVLSMTTAVIDLDLANTGSPSAFSVFDTDTDQVIIDQAPQLAPWIGTGDIILTGNTDFGFVLTPPDEISFGAGGTVNYTVTYDFDVGLASYCTAKTSSAGCTASISTSDPAAFPSSGASDYSVTASGVQGFKNGLLFAGINGSANLPFNGGVLCVQPPTKRGPVAGSGGSVPDRCDGSFSTLVNDGNVIPFGLDAGSGNSGWYQYWYRDPLNGAGQLGTALSDAIQLDFL